MRPVVFSAEGRLNTKDKRAKEFKKSSVLSVAPQSSKSLTTKEELCLEYVKTFTSQYSTIHPRRKEPFLVADNEYGTKKLLCSTLRPTQIPIPELYDIYECASFLAGYILYEPLDPQTESPSKIFSPTQTLSSHTGDCFDMANVLCSFLLGDGYDAYIVYGYAPKFITLRDQSLTICPLIQPSPILTSSAEERIQQGSSASSSTAISSSEVPETTSSENPQLSSTSSQPQYVPVDNSVKTSQFLRAREEEKLLAARDTFELWIPEPLDSVPREPEDMKRVHAWVMVSAGRRDVRETLFLEPSTGRAYSLSNHPYLGIEAVWNHLNYWLSSDPERRISEIDFELNNSRFWDPLFVKAKSFALSSSEGSASSEDDQEDDLGLGGGGGGGGLDAGSSADSHGGTGLAAYKAFDAPPTWVEPLSMDRSKYLLRYPPFGKRTVQYHCAKADFFAKFSNPQCLVMRIVQFLDRACTIVKETHEWFEGRRDKLYKRIRYNLGKQRLVEYFHPGSFMDVKQWLEYPGKRIEVDFYVEARLDRLQRREEIIGKKVFEYFKGRTDHLVFRSVEVTVDKLLAGPRQTPLPGGSLAPELYVLNMVQEYERNPSMVPGTDVAKRFYSIREGKLVVQHHFGTEKITNNVKTFFHTHVRGAATNNMGDHAMAQEVGVEDSLEALQEANILERDCLNSFRASFNEALKLADFRKRFEANVESEKTVFEIALDRASDLTSGGGAGQEKSNEKQTRAADYLTPFLRKYDLSRLNREEALEIRQTCLDALKARLVERSNIIQNKLNEENNKLSRKQEQFQRSQRDGDLSTEEYEKYCTEAMFRIQILEQRLVNHDESALKKFAELDAKLSSDPRLKVLRS